MVYVYLLNTSTIEETEIEQYIHLLDEGRKLKINSLHDIKDKRNSFAIGILVLWVLQKYHIDKNFLYFTKNNKPKLYSNYCISLSHSGNYVCVAISNALVGVDIQEENGYMESMLNLYFNSTEQEEIKKDVSNFYKLWCRKESYIKAFDYVDLKEIPNQMDDYYYQDFYFDGYYGCVLSSSENYLVEMLDKKIIGEIKDV